MLDMENIAEKSYHSINTIEDVEGLIADGETEGQYLECKGSPDQPSLNKDLKNKLAKTISAFSNTGGGILLWGVSTTRHNSSGSDVLSQVEEIAFIKKFVKQINLAAATLIEPQIISCKSKPILRKNTDTKGIAITFVPPTPGDPVRSTIDQEFYLRVGDKSNKMPYETIRKMFAGTASPDLYAVFNHPLVELQGDESWKIPIILSNNSSAVARDVEVSVTILNDKDCDRIRGEYFVDQSILNPGVKIFMASVKRPIFRGKNVVGGSMIVKMNKTKLSKRSLRLKIDIFASNMRAKTYTVTVKLAKKGFSVVKSQYGYLY